MAALIIADVPVRVSSPVLIGRAAELDQLRGAFDTAARGRSTATLVAGEAGVGKTRLVTDFADGAGDSGALVLSGGCIDLGEGALPYAPIVEALRGLVRRMDSAELDAVVGSARSELARLVPDLGPVTADAASGLSVGSAQGRLFELVLGVLDRLAARSPVALIVEDLHWSDRSTRDLVGFLVRNLRDSRVALVLTYRSDELHRRHPLLPFLAELERSGRVERLELHPFDRAESAEQLRAIAGHAIDPALAESIHSRSGGNPFFAEELLVAAGEDGAAELPRTLRDVLLARVSELAEPTQEFLRIASAAGGRVDPQLLAEAVSLDDAGLYDALRESVGRQVLVPDPTAGTERYAFRHALLQEAVYEDLLPGERTRLHSAFARTLEERSSRDPSRAAELAYHSYAAHDLPRALESAVAAGRAAEDAYAFPEAQAQYERAIDLWDRVPDAEERAGTDEVGLLADAAGVARFTEPTRAVAHIQAAIRLADEAADQSRAGLLNERLGRYAWIAGQGELANAGYRTAMRLIPAEPPSAARARVVAGLAQILMLGARFADSRVLAEESLAIARAVGARDIEGHALNTFGLDRAIAGDVEGGIGDLRASLAIAEELEIVDDIGRAYANWIWVLENAGRFEEAIDLGAMAVDISERMGLMRFFGTHLLCGAADQLYRLGRWEESESAIRRADEAGPLGINQILVQELLGRLAMARGRFAEAAAHLHPLAPIAERAVDVQFVNPVQSSLAELAIWEGRFADAAARVGATLGMIGFTPEIRIGELFALGLRANADIAELARARRAREPEGAAIAAGEELLNEIRERHAVVLRDRPVFADGSAAWVALCEAEATRLRGAPDPHVWVRAAEAWEGLGRGPALAYARWREAEARLAARGGRELATIALQSALAIAERLDAEPLVREVTALGARARIVLRPEPTPGGASRAVNDPPDEAARLGLTAREREVLGLVALGRTNRQIADELFISENTAGVHVSRILGKLEVSGRTEAAAIAYRLGLVESVREPIS